MPIIKKPSAAQPIERQSKKPIMSSKNPLRMSTTSNQQYDFISKRFHNGVRTFQHLNLQLKDNGLSRLKTPAAGTKLCRSTIKATIDIARDHQAA